LGRDQETRYTPQGTAVSNFSLATTERRKDKSGEQQDITTWFRVSLWGKQAENIGQYLLKGRQVYVEGRLRTEEYTDRDGNKRMSLEVSATDVQLLGSKGEGPMGGAPMGGAVRPEVVPVTDLTTSHPPEDLLESRAGRRMTSRFSHVR
jgi:single-strand DNA-binding protein